jgi:type I restriction enzyme R subunit
MTPSYTPEQQARTEIDRQLEAAGWQVQDRKRTNLFANRGVAVREFHLKTGYADYLLCVDGKAIGAVEAKKVGTTLSGVHDQSQKYSVGLPDLPKAWHRPLPFLYESTGVETCFTNSLDPEPRSRNVFCIHRPETELLGASLSKSDMRFANIEGANPSGSDLREVNLAGANLTNVVLESTNLEGAIHHAKTI